MVGILYIEEQKSFFIVMVSYLFGDALQIGASIYFAESFNEWKYGIIISIVLTVILMIFRIIIIIKPQWLGFTKKGDKKEVIREDN